MKHALSLRWRMMVLFCIVVGVLLLASYAAFYFAARSVVRTQLDRRMAESATLLAADLNSDPDDADIVVMDIPGEFFETVGPSGNVIALSKNLNGHAIPWIASSRNPVTIHDPVLGRLRVYSTPVHHGNTQEALLLAMPTRDTDQILARFRNLLFVLFPCSLLIVGAVAAWYVGRSLEPITELTREASQMAKRVKLAGPGALPARAPRDGSPLAAANRGDELGRLADAFNKLFVCMEGAVGQLRQFVSDASHELRTPLSVLQGETELLLREPRAPAEYQKALEVIDSELKKLSRIVEGLFTLAIADAGQLRLAREPLYLNETLEEACALVTPRARKKGIRIDRRLSEEVPYTGDEAFLRQLFLIFLDNSLKYSTRAGSIRVGMAVSNGNIRVQFADEGVGISPEHLPRIFERFYRVPQMDSTEAQSGGLGLAIAQAIVRAQDGSIECVSRPGAGSIFTVSLPRTAESSPARN
ncbi:MAG: ATP-binding protein [Candidatus Acidiferrales bacterium]